jgi:hypothetical protein
MQNRSAILVAIGFGGAGLVAGLLLSRSKAAAAADEARAAEHAAATAARSEEAVRRPEPSILERPEARVPVTTELPAAEPPPPSATIQQAAPPALPSSDPRDLPETTIAEMTTKRAALGKLLAEKADPILFKRFDDNLAERVSDAGTYAYTPADDKAIMAVRMPPEGGTWRTELPRAGYGDLYALKDEMQRLDKLIGDAEVQEYLKKRQAEGSPK